MLGADSSTRRNLRFAMAAPPIPVTSPGGPDTPEGPIILPANCAVVASTFVILDWQPAAAAPGGGAQVQLPTFAAVKAFLPFCRLSRNPADLAAAGAVNVLEVRLTDAAWSRIFTEMEAAQVFSQSFPTVGGLHKATRDAVYPTIANLEVTAGSNPDGIFSGPYPNVTSALQKHIHILFGA